MKMGFYPKLAWDGIRKNKRIYLPYILMGSVMVMMHYILSFLTESPALEEMPGSTLLRYILPLGCMVIAVFSLIFLFYTNSFLIKQRYREFGLYNILGMDKRNISRLMVWEALFTAFAAIVAGLAAGIAFSKASELMLLNILDLPVTYTVRVAVGALKNTILIYLGIYGVLLIHSLIRVRLAKPLELVESSKVGEKIPKFTWLFAFAGAILLGGAYYMAVTIKEPTTALFTFFIAVLMVIVGTYLLFISGSVFFCRMLQKNKNYYYKPNHFVAVSSMVYRMKRNGAGLASICILLTMVLVMLSSTTTLYFGEEGAVRNRYPNGVNIKIDYDDIAGIEKENLDTIRSLIAPYAAEKANLSGTRYGVIPGLFTEEGIIVDYENVESVSLSDYDNVGYLYVISLEDYNHMVGEEKTLEDGECFLYCKRLETQWETFGMEIGSKYQVKERLERFREDGEALAMTMPCVYMVVKDVRAFAEPIFDMKNSYGESMMQYEWLCGLDYDTPEEEIAANASIFEVIAEYLSGYDKPCSFYVQSRELQRESFFEMYGSLFFLGIMLSIVFLLAAVLIIYYKQISEGYEDQKRFEIMQKIGMRKVDIRRNINAQMLIVFFLPLLLAGIHLAFAFPYISKILLMFAFDDTFLNISVTVLCYMVFGIFYTIVYKLTSCGYYGIVRAKNE